MNAFVKSAAAIASLAVAIAVCAPAPDASNAHFVVVNNNDAYGWRAVGNSYATVLRLEGSIQNPFLNQVASLNSGKPSAVQIFASTPTIQIPRAGSDVCLFMVDSAGPHATTPNEITAFKYPSMQPVGSFNNPNVSNSLLGIVIVARGGYLFAAYDGYQTDSYLATWQVNSGCTLTLLGTYPNSANDVTNMSITPDGKTLVMSEFNYQSCCVDSFSVGEKGELTEHGPYGVNGQRAVGLDITADGKYALFNTGNVTGVLQVNVFAINSDGSLGEQYAFGGDSSLGDIPAGYYLWLSPDERFIFADGSNGRSAEVTTLNFTESPLNLTYTGCTTELKPSPGVYAWSMATAASSGPGSALYVAEANNTVGQGSIGLLAIDQSTGCTTEGASSPLILTDTNAASESLIVWPSRPF